MFTEDDVPGPALTKPAMIARTLGREIRSGVIPPGGRLASEKRLCQRFSASRNTVRRGLAILAQEGLIATHPGLGSFVTFEGTLIAAAQGWSRALARGSGEVVTEQLRLDRGPDDFAARFLDLGDATFLRLDRLRILAASGLVISYERSRTLWHPALERVPEEGLVDGSLNATLARAGLVAASGEEWAEVIPALGADDARVMRRRPGEPMLQLRRVTRTAEGRVIEYVESVLDPARFALHLKF